MRSSSKRGIALVRADLPDDVRARLGPISSIMGEILLIGLTAEDDATSLRDVRTFAGRIERTLADLQREAGDGIDIHGDLFRQAAFIERAVDNVLEAVRDGSLIVAIVLILFLWNLRAAAITLLALPLSLFGGIAALSALGFGVNTMTLGGLAVAVGELVDDAVVDVENCFGRLRENRLLAEPRPAHQVIFEASSEIRNSIVLATITVILVFVPLFFLGGVEGRLFQPLAVVRA